MGSSEEEKSALDILRARIGNIVNLSLDEVEKTLRVGTPAAKAAVMKTTLPALIKILGDEQQADELEELRDLVRQNHERERESIGKIGVDPGDGEATILHLAVPEDDAGGG